MLTSRMLLRRAAAPSAFLARPPVLSAAIIHRGCPQVLLSRVRIMRSLSSSAPSRDAYATLGLPPGPPLKDVKVAYYRLAMQTRPDLSEAADSSESFAEVAEPQPVEPAAPAGPAPLPFPAAGGLPPEGA